MIKQDVNAQLHDNFDWPETNCAQNPYGGIRMNGVEKSNELTRIVAWFPE
jgi:hypothetical protein